MRIDYAQDIGGFRFIPEENVYDIPVCCGWDVVSLDVDRDTGHQFNRFFHGKYLQNILEGRCPGIELVRLELSIFLSSWHDVRLCTYQNISN